VGVEDLINKAVHFCPGLAQGSLAYCSVLSVIETCRLRKVDPWAYIAMILTQARRGIKHPPIPLAS
jgi:transposase